MTVTLTRPVPDKCNYAYLCVFNSGRWVAIAAGKIDTKAHTATFPWVGGNIVYYPAYCVEKKLRPAGPVFTLATDGTVARLETPVEPDGARIGMQDGNAGAGRTNDSGRLSRTKQARKG